MRTLNLNTNWLTMFPQKYLTVVCGEGFKKKKAGEKAKLTKKQQKLQHLEQNKFRKNINATKSILKRNIKKITVSARPNSKISDMRRKRSNSNRLTIHFGAQTLLMRTTNDLPPIIWVPWTENV